MEQLIAQLADRLFLDEFTVTKGVAGFLRYLRDRLPPRLFARIVTVCPEAEELSLIEGSMGMGEEVADRAELGLMDEAFEERMAPLGSLYALMYSEGLNRHDIGMIVGFLCRFLERDLGPGFCDEVMKSAPEMGALHHEAYRLLHTERPIHH